MNGIGDTPGQHIVKIVEFIGRSSGLKSWPSDGDGLQITQKTDGKSLQFKNRDVDEVISRIDSEGQPFLQINFMSGKKILLTDNYIGFKPAQCSGLDMEKLPKVVTTPDLLSVVEAIEDSITAEATTEEVDVLKRVFDSVLRGGESVGFDLTSERLWLQRITKSNVKASA